jgi:hypothetical protein
MPTLLVVNMMSLGSRSSIIAGTVKEKLPRNVEIVNKMA